MSSFNSIELSHILKEKVEANFKEVPVLDMRNLLCKEITEYIQKTHRTFNLVKGMNYEQLRLMDIHSFSCTIYDTFGNSTNSWLGIDLIINHMDRYSRDIDVTVVITPHFKDSIGWYTEKELRKIVGRRWNRGNYPRKVNAIIDFGQTKFISNKISLKLSGNRRLY